MWIRPEAPASISSLILQALQLLSLHPAPVRRRMFEGFPRMAPGPELRYKILVGHPAPLQGS